MKEHRFLTIVLAMACFQAPQAQVVVAELPMTDGPHKSGLYEVRVRPMTNPVWQQVPVLRCDVNTRRVQQAAFAEFDMGESVVVQVVCHQTVTPPPASDSQESLSPAISLASSDIRIRPTSRGIRHRIVGTDTLEFTLSRPEYLSIEFDGDRQHNLHILANALEDYRPDLTDSMSIINWQGIQSQDVFIRNPRLIYFGPGVHKPKDLPGGDIRIPSNCTVYLALGAVVKARLLIDHAENVRIIGRGIVDHPLRGVEITYSRNVVVDGLTFLNPSHYTIFGGESSEITVRNIKSFSARPWSDGIDLMCCRQVKVENCFLRTSDDCIALYNHRWWYWGGSADIEVSRCVFWPDVAHPVNIGSHGDDRNPEGETLRHVRIHDCDILYNDGDGLLAVNCGDLNHIRDIRFDSIRAEGIRRGRVFDLRIFQSEKYNRAPGCCIDSVFFSDITISPDVPDSCLLPSRVEGLPGHPVGYYSLQRVSHTDVIQ